MTPALTGLEHVVQRALQARYPRSRTVTGIAADTGCSLGQILAAMRSLLATGVVSPIAGRPGYYRMTDGVTGWDVSVECERGTPHL